MTKTSVTIWSICAFVWGINLGFVVYRRQIVQKLWLRLIRKWVRRAEWHKAGSLVMWLVKVAGDCDVPFADFEVRSQRSGFWQIDNFFYVRVTFSNEQKEVTLPNGDTVMVGEADPEECAVVKVSLDFPIHNRYEYDDIMDRLRAAYDRAHAEIA